MSHLRTLARAATIALSAVAIAHAGTFFRLEIGPPVAAGTDTNFKQLKTKVALVVRPRLCDNLGSVEITGTAEGLVNGMRRSVPLKLLQVNAEEGVYAVSRQWPEQGQWVLQLNGTCSSPKASASTLVPMNGSSFIREKTEVLGEPATKKQLEAILAALARSQS